MDREILHNTTGGSQRFRIPPPPPSLVEEILLPKRGVFKLPNRSTAAWDLTQAIAERHFQEAVDHQTETVELGGAVATEKAMSNMARLKGRLKVVKNERVAARGSGDKAYLRQVTESYVELVRQYKTAHSTSLTDIKFENMTKKNMAHLSANLESPLESEIASLSMGTKSPLSSSITSTPEYSNERVQSTSTALPAQSSDITPMDHASDIDYNTPASRQHSTAPQRSQDDSPRSRSRDSTRPMVQINAYLGSQTPTQAPSPAARDPFYRTESADWPELRKRISERNLYDSGDVLRSSVPKLDMEARDDAIGDLAGWFETVDRNSRVYWLRGPKLSGKTAIIQHVVERCVGLGQPAASFFFTQPVTRSDVMSELVPTLVHDIVRCMTPKAEDYYGLLGWLRSSGPSCLGSRMDQQVNGLVSRMFNRLQSKKLPRALLITLDGLDLCDADALVEVFHFIEHCIQALLPVCFLISSEVTDGIERRVDSKSFSQITGTKKVDLVPFSFLSGEGEDLDDVFKRIRI
ncbi:hypothetical protein DFP72DRAFT_1173178 [Ephemerocybe angulata]|uniref:Nephrocystin 3-like N-terminal domain-containing protein n=1 Tax=Ephemerocybe angulata TaxID=980116 RepID=A0A8H6HQ32_9AGAR|nr:hypothetical protein DFP72DRAFT_1173178 [Tulosesus angulatus]